jgi:hypothetical protein
LTIAALPDHILEAIAVLLSIPCMSGLKYTDWNQEILNWVHKEEGNPDVNKRRPLIYYEVMKKMHYGIRLHRITQL